MHAESHAWQPKATGGRRRDTSGKSGGVALNFWGRPLSSLTPPQKKASNPSNNFFYHGCTPRPNKTQNLSFPNNYKPQPAKIAMSELSQAQTADESAHAHVGVGVVAIIAVQGDINLTLGPTWYGTAVIFSLSSFLYGARCYPFFYLGLMHYCFSLFSFHLSSRDL